LTQAKSQAGWRLPNVKELSSLVGLDRVRSPSIDINAFPNTGPIGYWTSSPDAANSSRAWGVYFDEGYASGSYRSRGIYVRLVR
jgi:hypothetical protein